MKKLGFGMMRLPVTDPDDRSKIDHEQVCQMVDTFLERGFTYFDTAYMYHDYNSENAVREALVKRHPRDSFTIATKMPTMFLKKQEDLERIFQEQMTKLGVDYFDYYLLHCLDKDNYPNSEKFDTFAFCRQKKEEGVIKNLGFSFHDTADYLDEILTAHPYVDFVQLQINYLDWESPVVQSRKCYEVCVKHGKKVVVMEPVKGGTLAKVPEEGEALMKAREPEMSVASWAVRYAASLENVFMVLSGMSNMEQLCDNTGYMMDFQPLNAEEQDMVAEVAEIIRASRKIDCTACRYCTEGCPRQIPIPDYFKLFNRFYTENGQGSAIRAEYSAKVEEGCGAASACVGCGQCERHCPQHLPIIKNMKKVSELFE